MPAATSNAGMLTCKSRRNFVPPIAEDDENSAGYRDGLDREPGSLGLRRTPAVRTPKIAAVSSGPMVTRNITIAEAANSTILLIVRDRIPCRSGPLRQ